MFCKFLSFILLIENINSCKIVIEICFKINIKHSTVNLYNETNGKWDEKKWGKCRY